MSVSEKQSVRESSCYGRQKHLVLVKEKKHFWYFGPMRVRTVLFKNFLRVWYFVRLWNRKFVIRLPIAQSVKIYWKIWKFTFVFEIIVKHNISIQVVSQLVSTNLGVKTEERWTGIDTDSKRFVLLMLLPVCHCPLKRRSSFFKLSGVEAM